MFVIVMERLVHEAKVIGPIPHKEEAETYAHDYVKGIWRVVQLTPPEHDK